MPLSPIQIVYLSHLAFPIVYVSTLVPSVQFLAKYIIRIRYLEIIRSN